MNIMNATIFEFSKYLRLIFWGCIASVVIIPAFVQAAECQFTRSLYVGVAPGQDIRCLQQYLNETNYQVAENGVGAPGQETTMYADKTRAAVLEWQLDNNITGANGVFGPASRALYAQLTKNSDTDDTFWQVVDTNTLETNNAHIQSDSEIGKIVNNALQEVDQVQRILDNSEYVSTSAQAHMNKARSAIIDMLFAAFNNEDSMVLLQATIAINRASQAEDAIETQKKVHNSDAIDKQNKKQAQVIDTLDQARGMIDDAQDKLDQAGDKLDHAQDDYEDTNWASSLQDARAAIAHVRSINANL